MKKIFLGAFLLMSSFTFAQASYGVRGGLNYGATGDFESYPQAVGEASTVIQGDNKTGYHLGLFAKLEIIGFFLQPELLYTKLNTEYDNLEYSVSKIDAPILVGINLLGPLNIKAGPSFQYILKNEFEDSLRDVSDVENPITLGYQLGAGLNLGRLGVDLRYEGAFKENNAFGSMATDNNIRVDSRPSQWILGLSYSFN